MRKYATLYDGFKSQNMVIYQEDDKPGWAVHGYVQNAQDAEILAAGLNARALQGVVGT